MHLVRQYLVGELICNQARTVSYRHVLAHLIQKVSISSTASA